MRKYYVTVKETTVKRYTVEAENVDDARYAIEASRNADKEFQHTLVDAKWYVKGVSSIK